MAFRWVAWCALVALVAGAPRAHGQVGPPMDDPVRVEAVKQPERELVEPPPAARRSESEIPLLAAPSEPGPTGGSATPSAGGWARSLASVSMVIGLILVLAALAKFVSRRSGSVAAMMGPGGRAPSGVLEVLARYPVGRGQVLVLLRIDRRVLLLSQNMAAKGGSFTTLAQFDDPSEVAAILRQTRDEASESVSVRFRQALERFQGGDAEVDGVERGEIIEVGPRGEPLPRGRGVWA
ncbi:MAG: flagellar biosynthetic protein FliO [Phycisphaerales bacterium]|jgi:flagellar biogenesis protein FliO